MKNFLKTFHLQLLLMFRYLGLLIIKPSKALNQLKKEKYQVHLTVLLFLISVLLFTPFLVGAAFTLRPDGWVQLFVKVPQNMIYVYFAATAPLSIMLNMLSLGIIYFFAVFMGKEPKSNKQLWSTTQFSLTLVVMYDFLVEAFAIVFLWIAGTQQFPTWLVIGMHLKYGVMFLWGIILLMFSIEVCFDKIKRWQSLLLSTLSYTGYFFLMAIWIGGWGIK